MNERMLEKAVEGQLGSLAKYGEHQDAAVLFCKLHHCIACTNCDILKYLTCTHPITIPITTFQLLQLERGMCTQPKC